jgi:hypothetical protein
VLKVRGPLAANFRETALIGFDQLHVAKTRFRTACQYKLTSMKQSAFQIIVMIIVRHGPRLSPTSVRQRGLTRTTQIPVNGAVRPSMIPYIPEKSRS